MIRYFKEAAFTLLLAAAFSMNAACAPKESDAIDAKTESASSAEVENVAAAQKAEGEKLPTEKPSAQFYGKSRNAWQLFNQATYKTVAWPGKPKSWVRMRVDEGTLHMTPHEIKSKQVTTIRVPLNVGNHQLNATAMLKKECKYPVDLEIGVGDSGKVDRKLGTISIKPGVETPVNQSFEVVQGGRELVITVKMAKGAKDNFNSAVALKNLVLELK